MPKNLTTASAGWYICNREQGTTPLRSALGWPPNARLRSVNLLHTLGVDADVLGIALVAHISSAGSRSF